MYSVETFVCRGFLSPFSSKHRDYHWGIILVNDINDSLSSWKAISSCQLKGVLKERSSFKPRGSKCVSLSDSDPLDEFGSNSSSVGLRALQMQHRALGWQWQDILKVLMSSAKKRQKSISDDKNNPQLGVLVRKEVPGILNHSPPSCNTISSPTSNLSASIFKYVFLLAHANPSRRFLQHFSTW